MIGKCKAIAHGSTALDYIFREGKLGNRLAFHNICSKESKAIYEEMKLVSDYNTRCRNKFLRIEIGIAPQDEKKLSVSELAQIAHLFAKKMGLDNHQWVAVTHKDTDNRHIHIIANRISLYGEVYDTTFVSNKAARITEEISREKGLTIAEEVKIKRKHQKAKDNPTREETKRELQRICYALLEKYKSTGITGHSMFLYELNKHGVTIDRMKNKQSKVYGLKFSYGEYSFKASEVGREFGYRSLKKNFEPTNKEVLKRPHQTILEPIEKNEQPDTGYQLVPKSRSSISRDNDIPQMQSPIDAVADIAMSVVDEVLEGLGGMITPTAQGDDYAEAAWQRKLRYQANKKKRGRRL
ncbi:relaxase/mobilization nuclease domain protein [Prevotella sp. DNF00663]|uniref:relaxase/mobilization nuclease domain-containing protein n=1 Tax=Prevotella sp. DNF00663 TaxID=1384078 RepID=UPI0007828B8A|nr:relaxase/mobilization nuclease domain-containing protein [Prevotella sp. DNF00663]KXB84663.1 relaxase/mobilization nuclease domain protein [Prevotella sp. DNF00663]